MPRVRPIAICRTVVAILLALQWLACERRNAPPSDGETVADAAAEKSTPPHSSSRQATTPGKPVTPPPAAIWKEFSGERAFAEVRTQVQFGPRPAGSAELERARDHLRATLRRSGWHVEDQAFTESTPRGPIRFVNLIARHPGAEGGGHPSSARPQAIVCSHYDTKRFSTITFVGANDAASSTGALLELARVLALDPDLASRIELVFFDGEEAVAQFSESDGLYGSRHYARKLHEENRSGQFKFGILWDMIGDKDLTITCPPDSPQPLTEQIFASAEALGLRSHFGYYDRQIMDDHVPLNAVRIPTVDLIDFDFLAWHTADDTLEKLDPDSLRKVGAVTLHYLQHALRPRSN